MDRLSESVWIGRVVRSLGNLLENRNHAAPECGSILVDIPLVGSQRRVCWVAQTLFEEGRLGAVKGKDRAANALGDLGQVSGPALSIRSNLHSVGIILNMVIAKVIGVAQWGGVSGSTRGKGINTLQKGALCEPNAADGDGTSTINGEVP